MFVRDFWRRHKKKVYVSLGVVGGGYFLYKLYDTHKRHLYELERELAGERENEDRIKTQLQEHFETIQRIVDTTTMPHAINYLGSKVAEELDLSAWTERLMLGKGQPNTLTPTEKMEIWDRLKVLSFTRMVLSLWAMTMLSLFIRVQVNILGRHLYIGIARGLEGSHLIDESNLIDHEDEQKFLSSADYLATCGLPALTYDLQAAATEYLRSKQLRDVINTAQLHETILQILDIFMSMGNHHHWVEYLMSEESRFYNSNTSSSDDQRIFSDVSKFDQLMSETRAVLSSTEFRNVAEVSLRTVAEALVKEINDQPGAGNLSSGIPLAKLLPRIAQMGPLLLDDPTKNQFIQLIRSIPDVELFFTLLYANSLTR